MGSLQKVREEAGGPGDQRDGPERVGRKEEDGAVSEEHVRAPGADEHPRITTNRFI